MGMQNYSFNGIKVVFNIDDNNQARLIYLGREKEVSEIVQERARWYRGVEVQLSGENHNDHHFNKHYGTSEGGTVKFVGINHTKNCCGDLLALVQQNSNVKITSYYQFYDGVGVVRSYTEVENVSKAPVSLEIVSSFESVGIFSEDVYDWEKELNIYIPHNTWQGECEWKRYSMHDLGLYNVQSFSGKRISAKSTGGWPTSEYLPMGMLESVNSGVVLWQIEHNGSWNWEISTIANTLYLLTGGPSAMENDWSKTLAPGEVFQSVKCAVAFGEEKNSAFASITDYRRIIKRRCEDNEKLPVIFNDYMNCLFGDPTTEKELPLIDKAAELGIEYYCIDSGWYDDGDWWTTVGEWKPAKSRFNGGFKWLIDYIRSKGMVPGIWLEIEVMGIDGELAKSLPDSWFFMRNGRRVIDHGRYQLDFSNPEVVAYADSVIDRLIGEYGIGYIKNDYNINCGKGTEYNSDSFGDGLFKHNKAYLKWIEGVLERYPDLIIESCSSGGMRMDYATLSVNSLQSVSDQTDYKKLGAIASNCVTAVVPEQAAIWSYPLKDGNEEETVFNMVNALLFRIHQSGNIVDLNEKRLALVKEGIDTYKQIRQDIRVGHPLFLSDFAYYDAPYCAYGLKTDSKLYVAVWNFDNLNNIVIKLDEKVKGCSVLYPTKLQTNYNFEDNTLTLLPTDKFTARVFMLDLEG